MTEKERLKEKEQYTFEDLKSIMRILRSEEGCPWDRKQTHESLIPCLKEEAGEVIEAIEKQDMENLCEELGDLLFQVMSHSRIAEENGCFSIDDVVHQISAKMVRRHPNVFGDVKVESAEEGLALWKRIKSQEKSEKS
ncbi:MAG: MazG family protein [Clostridium sp.]|nr:MazG family protein [Clostridium sp.]